MTKCNVKNTLYTFAIILCAALMLFFELGEGAISHITSKYAHWISQTLSRFFGGMVCVFLICRLSAAHLFYGGKNLSFKSLLLVLPCFLVAINNFPFLSVFMGRAELSTTFADILLYAVFCLTVGFFEETAFRGCVFHVILGRLKDDKYSVLKASLISSSVFGLIHIINLFSGASFGAVILQIGYSFLIGALCSILLIKTSNIWIPIIFHSLYNFCGGIVPNFGNGTIWTLQTVILTVIIGIIVAVYTVILWYNLTSNEIYYAKAGKLLTDNTQEL